MAACACSRGSTPWNSGATCPLIRAITVGTACNPSAWTMPGAVSTFSRASRNRPPEELAMSISASDSC